MPIFIGYSSRRRVTAWQLSTGVKARRTGEATARRHLHQHPLQIWELTLGESELQTGLLHSSKLSTCRTLPCLSLTLPCRGKDRPSILTCHSFSPTISVWLKRTTTATLWVLTMPTVFCRTTSGEKVWTWSTCFPCGENWLPRLSASGRKLHGWFPSVLVPMASSREKDVIGLLCSAFLG